VRILSDRYLLFTGTDRCGVYGEAVMRSGWGRRAVILLLALGTLVAGVGVAVSAPTSAQAAESPGQPVPRMMKFRLPYLDGVTLSPNKLNFARHAVKPGPLMLFLPATGASPANYQEFLDTASSAGFSVLALDYWNRGKSVTRTCRGNSNCYTRLQQNRFTGTDPSRFSRVDAANSILNRLKAALEYLQDNDPKGGWGRYMDEASFAIHWSNIVLAGHSQGGGESAFISHYHRVRGVLMFSSPVETYNDISASWLATPGATPVSRLYGLDSTSDMYYSRIVGTWVKLGMGTATAATAPEVPTGSHILLSSLYLGDPHESHGRTVADTTVRLKDGTPTLEPTWTWMLDQVRKRPAAG
jgi:hypothetical protein